MPEKIPLALAFTTMMIILALVGGVAAGESIPVDVRLIHHSPDEKDTVAIILESRVNRDVHLRPKTISDKAWVEILIETQNVFEEDTLIAYHVTYSVKSDRDRCEFPGTDEPPHYTKMGVCDLDSVDSCAASIAEMFKDTVMPRFFDSPDALGLLLGLIDVKTVQSIE